MAKTSPVEFVQRSARRGQKNHLAHPQGSHDLHRHGDDHGGLASVFFLVVDAILKWGIDKLLLGL